MKDMDLASHIHTYQVLLIIIDNRKGRVFITTDTPF